MTNGVGNSRACVSIVLALAFGFAAAHGVQAQQARTAIWEIPFGTPASELPAEFRIRACGTNGGPPSTPLRSFEEFWRCPAEQETGLHEVWFSYDDEAEYYLRANRASPSFLRRYLANQEFDHLVVFSLLFDSEGRVQGHRIATDPRDDVEIREVSDEVGTALKVGAYGADGWSCTDLPRLDGEEPFGGETFVKTACEKLADGRYITIETHRYLKAGQMAPGRGGAPTEGQFEVGTWAEAINADFVNNARLQ